MLYTHKHIPEFFDPLKISNKDLMIHSGALLTRLEKVNRVEISDVHSSGAQAKQIFKL